MARTRQDDAVDEFILDRWPEARDLADAFHKTNLKMRRRLKSVAEDLKRSLAAEGYETYLEEPWAELRSYRSDWGADPEQPMVYISVGAVYPVGYFKVEEASAYVCLYNDGFDDEQARRFADLLYEELGGRPAEWQDRTDDEYWECPLWAEIPNSDDRARVRLAQDPKELKAFMSEHLRKLTALADPIGRAVRRVASK